MTLDGDAADRLVVVRADDRDLLRHLDPQAQTRFEQLLPREVVRRHDADRLRQRAEPRREAMLLLLPAFGATFRGAGHGHRVHRAGQPALGDRLDEPLAAVL